MEEWKNIDGFPGYQVSNEGRVRSFYQNKKSFGTWGGHERILQDTPQRILRQSDDGNGYLKVYLQNDETGKRTCVKVHRLVADNFIPNPNGYDTVDHIVSGPEGKLDNSVTNLRWMPRKENIKKAYADGMCDSRIRSQRKPISLTDEWTNEELYFESVKDAADFVGVDRSTISHAIKGGSCGKCGHYLVEQAGREERLLYGQDECIY